MKEERTEQEKFWDVVRKDIETSFEFDYRKDERWTKAISEPNGDKEIAKHRYLQLRKKMLLDQVIRDIVKLIVINIVTIIVFVLATSAFENIDLPSFSTKSSALRNENLDSRSFLGRRCSDGAEPI